MLPIRRHRVNPHRRTAPLRVVALAAALAALACRTPSGGFVAVEDYPVQAAEPEYRIGAGDVLSIRVWNQESMSNPRARVRDDGRISIPFLQDVDVAGATPTELGQRLQARLKAYVVNPVVTVTVEEFRPLKVSVLGKVARPGQFELDRGSGVLQALAAAGGLTDFADRDGIYVLRVGQEAKPPTRIRFHYPALIRAEPRESSFRLRTGDVVVAE